MDLVKELQGDLKKIKEWLKTQQHLPQNIGKILFLGLKIGFDSCGNFNKGFFL